MKLLLLSSLVSIVTLIILLFNRSTPSDLRIPSSFLGGVRLTAPRKLSLTKPPLFLWFCVILATIGAVFAYWPPSREGRSEVSPQAVVVWVDDSLSSAIARTQHPPEWEDVASEISLLGRNVYGLRGALRAKGEKSSFAYELLPLSSGTAIEQFLRDEAQKNPSPFARPLDVEELSRVLTLNAQVSHGKAFLAVVSDAQRSTLQGLSSLKALFVGAKLFALAEPMLASPLREEIVPNELLSAWNVVPDSDENGLAAFSVLSSTGQDGGVPVHARPRIFREVFRSEEAHLSVISRSRNVAREFPFVTACADDLPGLQELDGFGDLRTLLHFLSASFRTEVCSEQRANDTFEESESWRFRQPTIWLVSLRDDVVHALAGGRAWFPKGFEAKGDALVYVAPFHAREAERGLLEETPVQLVEKGNPVVLYLSPLPPPDLMGPVGGQFERVMLEPMIISPDKTQLAFQAKGLPVFYLRTTLAMPNNELTRSSQWPLFWMTVAKSMGSGGGALPDLREPDASDFFAQGKLSSRDGFVKYSLRLNPETLAWDSVDFEREGLRAGLYLSPSTSEKILIDFPDEEFQPDFLSVAEFERSWNEKEAPSSNEKVSRERRLLPFLGALLASFALALLWSVRRKSIVTALVLFAFSPVAERAHAQSEGSRNFVQVANVPFRLMWCGEQNTHVQARYNELRELLARRGTIRLADSLLFGPCAPGSAEVWWTDNVFAFRMDDVRKHISGGGFVLVEGQKTLDALKPLLGLENFSVGLKWESPPKRGMFYRSFYLLHTFDGCPDDKTRVLQLRKRANASAPVFVFTSAHFLSQGEDCFGKNEDYRTRSFVNLFYAVLTTDYKEDHMRLPELLDRVRNLGLEP